MNDKLFKLLFFCFSLFFLACKSKTEVDYIIYNANIYTVDASFSKQEAMAIKDGKIVATGTSKSIFDLYEATLKTDLNGKTILPGLYDAHTHFYYYALGLKEVDLVGTRSFNQVLERVLDFSKTSKTPWIKGRGWDQNDWRVKEFPNKDSLDKLFPDLPVFLSRIDGHAALANQKALDIAGVTNDLTIEGGIFETKLINGKKVLAIIPARGGSKGLVSKNIKPINGLPLISWSIKQALNSKLIDQCVVSTDSPEIQKISIEAGAQAPFLRPDYLATDTASSLDVIFHTINYFEEKGMVFDYLLLIEPTSPLREPDDFDNMITLLDKCSATKDAVVSVGKVHQHPYIMKKIINNDLLPFITSDEGEKRRQELEDAFFPYGVGYLIKIKTLKEEKSFYPKRLQPYVIQRYQCYEIDDIYDFLAIENVMKHEWSTK
jgi:N-acylneuraminate cytidylyltransferase/CMP-N,N'-diacetyllegionaminic acid synthase